jgi:hypothetical protein
MKRRLWLITVGLLIAAALAIYFSRPRPGHVKDEARRAGRDAGSFPAADEDYFHDMDGGIPLTKEEIKGRNTWIVWTGGNDHLWDQLSVKSVGTLDFLKTLSSYPKLKFSRSNRWSYLGLVNEPCFEQATGPDAQRFGLWLDRRRADCPPDPFENEAKYPGVKIGARGKNLPAGSFYGCATGIVGLRLFANPDFDEAAAKKWDATKYYEDENYYSSKDLVKPYRVAMSCGFCHVGPSPTKPPADPENPKWENLSSVVGAQYFWVDRIFSWQADPRSFFYQLFHTSRPGTLDTSLVSTDNINNPRTMNAVYNLSARLQLARMTANWGKESLAHGELNNKQFNDFVHEGPLTQLFQPPDTVWTPRVLKDGSDSVGALGALNRVYLNIGLFSEEWLLHFWALVGGKPITPIEIAVARKNSAYWEATEQQTFDMALFLVKASAPHLLKSVPRGAAYLTKDQSQLTRGKIIFAERCARCHSSKLPTVSPENDPGGCSPEKYLDCWNRYWNWTKTPEFKQKMKEIVLKNDFLEGNYLSTDLRVPVTLLQTNACSPLATNAIAGNIWDNFSSQNYKNLPSVGSITWYHPVTGEPRTYRMPAGGRGYTRPASLISAWSTAPFLLNNSVGKFDPSPSVEARMASFQNSIEQMLWPEKRDQDLVLGSKIPGRIDRTTHTSYIFVAPGYLPDFLKPLLHPGRRLFPWLIGDEGIQIGPIPKGTPVDLLANLDLLGEAATSADRAERQAGVFNLLSMMISDLRSVEGKSDEEVQRKFANLVDPLLKLSKCPDFIVNRGHYFGTSQFPEEPGLSDGEKRALIEFIKTF